MASAAGRRERQLAVPIALNPTVSKRPVTAILTLPKVGGASPTGLVVRQSSVHTWFGDRGLLRCRGLAGFGSSASSIQVGAWSLDLSQPRTTRSTPAAV